MQANGGGARTVMVPAGGIAPAGTDYEAAGPDFKAAGPDFEAGTWTSWSSTTS